MTRTPHTIRTRRDGSIDTAYYMEQGRMARSRQAHKLARDTARATRAPRLGLLAVLAALFHLPGGQG